MLTYQVCDLTISTLYFINLILGGWGERTNSTVLKIIFDITDSHIFQQLPTVGTLGK